MNSAVRTHVVAGIAVVGVGAVALAPLQPPPGQSTLLPHRAAELAVGLAAAVEPLDPIAAVQAAFTATTDNLIGLITNSIQGIYVQGRSYDGSVKNGGYKTGVPLPIPQQIAQNLPTYLSELPDIGLIFTQAFGNIGNALGAPFKPGAEILDSNPIFPGTQANWNQNIAAAPPVGNLGVAVNQRTVAAQLPFIAPDLAAALKPILDFATTPISGVLLGLAGPLLAPVLSVVNSITNTFALLQESNVLGALTELVNIPTNAVSAFLNGGPTLDATGLIGLIAPLPPEVKKIGFQMGGLLSPGGVAGDALAATAEIVIGDNPPKTLETTGLPVGPIGAMVNTSNYVATAIKVTPPPTAAAGVAPAPAAAEEPAQEFAAAALNDEPVTANNIANQAEPEPTPAQRGRSTADGSDDNGGSGTSRSAVRGKRGAD